MHFHVASRGGGGSPLTLASRQVGHVLIVDPYTGFAQA